MIQYALNWHFLILPVYLLASFIVLLVNYRNQKYPGWCGLYAYVMRWIDIIQLFIVNNEYNYNCKNDDDDDDDNDDDDWSGDLATMA